MEKTEEEKKGISPTELTWEEAHPFSYLYTGPSSEELEEAYQEYLSRKNSESKKQKE